VQVRDAAAGRTHTKFVNFEPRGNLGLFLRVPKVSTSKAHAKRGDSVRNHPVL
jgi:hypothetical protein